MFDYTAPSDLLRDRIILITGASGGIGRAAALSFARHGATIIATARRQEALESLYDEIMAAGGAEPFLHPLDLLQAEAGAFSRIVEAIDEQFGRLDCLLNNASILGEMTPVEFYPLETWRKVLDVNLTASFALSRYLIPLLRKAPDPSLILTTSGVGQRARAYWGAYSVSKVATEGLMQILSAELDDPAHPIRVNCINPGATHTRMRSSAYPGEKPESNPEPAEILPLYLFLAGSDSRGVTGLSLNAQGTESPASLARLQPV